VKRPKGQERSQPRPVEAPPRERWRPGAWVWSLVAVAAVLVVTIDDRMVGHVPDGVQMIRVAVAMIETGGIGIGRGPTTQLVRPEGDAVSKYGLGMSVAQLPAAALAPLFERLFGHGRSQPLFLLAPFLGVLLAAAASGLAAQRLGAGQRGAALAVLFASLGSPLASYAGMELSEPVQAASLAVAFAASLEAAARSSVPLGALAGAAAGFAVLTKSSLVVVAPFALLPLLASDRRLRLVVAAALGAVPALGLWVWSDVVRFGRPLGAYAGEGFTHPLLDGAWRLLVGPNRGMVLFFPATFVALWAVADRLRRRAGAAEKLAAGGALLAFVSLFAMASSWWAWHGVVGWGPRLLVPAIPLLAALAGAAVEGWPRAAGLGFAALSVVLNLPPLLQPAAPVDLYTIRSAKAVVDEATARQLPAGMLEKNRDGTTLMWADQILATVPQASPHVVFPWYWAATRADSADEVARRLAAPPWLGARPDITPDLLITSAVTVRKLVPPPRVAFLGRGFFRSPDDRGYETTYLSALADQIMRAHQVGDWDRALALAIKLDELGSTPLSAACLVETYRRLRRYETASAFLQAQPASKIQSPRLAAAAALLARDLGDEAGARASLARAALAYPGTPAQAALTQPLAEWAADLFVLTGMAGPSGPRP
jgi:Dolichyl-phosphate-mannose-protein mannosyltransferase